MKKQNSQYSFLMTTGLVLLLVYVYNEILSIWAMEQRWDRLLAPVGLATIVAYVGLFLLGLLVLLFAFWSPGKLRTLGRFIRLRWLLVALLILSVVWFYLYSIWQTVFPGPWTQYVFAAGLACLIGWILNPEHDLAFGWSGLALTFGLFLYPRIVHETRSISSLAITYRSVTIGGYALLLVLAYLLYGNRSADLSSKLIAWRGRLGKKRFVLAFLLFLTPLVYWALVGAETYALYTNLRFALILLVLWAAAYLLGTEADRVVQIESLWISLGGLMLVSFLVKSLLLVVDYPFSLFWSEGNRFYDYSLIFGQSLYEYPGTIINPYSSPGRYSLWGILFLWPGLPIWAHRLWNAFLQFAGPLLFAGILTRKFENWFVRTGLFLWVAIFFTAQAQLHVPFMLVASLMAYFAFDKSATRRGIAVVIASTYAALSRWTWIVAPAAWAALIDLFFFYPKREGSFWRRIAPAALQAALGLLPGLVINIVQFFKTTSVVSLLGKQPLLWYRLLPNDTLGPGIVILALISIGPLVALLIWLVASRRWKLDWVQQLALWGVLAAFFVGGLVVSTKIGGGGDLHNLDMFLVTLTFVSVFGIYINKDQFTLRAWPAPAVGMLFFLALIPIMQFTPFSVRSIYSDRTDLPKQVEIDDALQTIETEVDKASKEGEVLFMDQRQLLTFGYIKNVPLVPEYEKKYMMDQAMGNNEPYFRPYFEDLARKRFTLIVTEPLKLKLKEEMGGPFSEENDAWVIWVAEPTLCFYEPIYTSKDVNVQLLVPRPDPVGCEKFLQ